MIKRKKLKLNLPMPYWAENLIVFDTETTGVSPTSARIVSACLALLGPDGSPTERYDWLLDPEVAIPASASAVHGITNEIVKKSGIKAETGLGQIIDKVNDFLETGLPLVVYNAPYDLTLLKNEATRHGLTFDVGIKPVLDPLVLDRQLDKFRRGKRTLVAVCEHYGVTLEDAHDAGADAIAAGQVLQKLAAKYKNHLPDDIDDLHLKQVDWCLEQAESFQDYMRRVKNSNFTANGSWPILK